VIRQFATLQQYSLSAFGFVARFDPSGTLWTSGFIGFKADTTAATPIALADNLLAFDAMGRLYTRSAGGALNVYTLDANDTPTLTRTITPNAPPCSAAVDDNGNVYVGLCGNSNNPFGEVVEYGPTGNGNVIPIAMNVAASAPVAVSSTGNLYAIYNNGSENEIGIWNAGTFGSVSPTGGTVSIPSGYSIADISVDASGTLRTVQFQLDSKTCAPVGISSGYCDSIAAPFP
ncbi:MAG TPA: hypothetical protein VGD50_07465, partial [Candidatus Baltobacteraceae bacterium]